MQTKEVKSWQDAEALKRFQMISPLLDESLDAAAKSQLRDEIARKNEISKRSIYRYEQYFRDQAFEGLRPQSKTRKPSASLPDNYDEVFAEAIQLKREVPRRSVRQIIKILELEGYAAPGVLKRSTLQRHLYNAGFSQKQLRRYAEKRATSARRFCKAHRMELVQADIKYGPTIRLRDGTKVKTYLSSLIDDHSRYILHSQFYDNQRDEIVEDSFHKAVLCYGKWDCCYLDNGKQYISQHLQKACARLGIKVLYAKPRACESKGKIERFHQKVDQFINEIRVAHVHSVEELNHHWKIFLEKEYQQERHSGIEEYYRSQGVQLPSGGITPKMEWDRDERNLTFLDVSVVSEAFMHRESRRLDNAGCFSFKNQRYEVSAALANTTVEIAYDPASVDVITVYYQNQPPIKAKRLKISGFTNAHSDLPIAMTSEQPKGSRLLDALEKQSEKERKLMANALSFSEYGKEGESHV